VVLESEFQTCGFRIRISGFKEGYLAGIIRLDDHVTCVAAHAAHLDEKLSKPPLPGPLRL
jgi:hypothetical protein